MSESTGILKKAVAAAKETLQSLLGLDLEVAKAADLTATRQGEFEP